MQKVRIGVIGTGSISEMHLKSYKGNPHADLVAICDVNEERARQVADKYGATKVYTDYRQLVADAEIDAVSVCTWNNTHAPISIAALQAGKHVLVEKPLCHTMEEAYEVEKAVRESGKLLQVGYVRRFDPNVKMIREFVDQGEFGELYYAKASTLRRLGNPG